MVNLIFWALTFDFLGKFLIAVTALLTHRRLVIEKHVDKLVLHDMRYEITVGVIGIISLLIGYILHLRLLYP